MSRNRNATPQFIGALTEMVWMQIGRLILCGASYIPYVGLTVAGYRERRDGFGKLQPTRWALDHHNR